MAEIRVLDKHTAELIAAGEVVERPASVVKELLENAIDAGSTQVTVTIESGGIRLIEISDNGSGIEAKYIPTAFIRHATSKIRTEDDLTHIHTLGFRGEALASIASVARVEVLTRTADAECASVYHIEGGEEQPMEPGARGVGTTIRVRDLFYNTPARMKFLKKDSSEGTFVADIVAHVALSHPEVSFKFVREGKRIRHDHYGMGSYVIAFEEEAGSAKDVEITEVDIDNFIRAKGAIFSAIRTMLNSLDFDVSMIDDVYVAGGIGSGINMANAVHIGMFPDIPLEKFHYIGNSSLTGAYLMLHSTSAEKKTYELASNMTYLELSTVPTYMDEFVGACFIPHTDTNLFPSVMEEQQKR